MGSLNENRLVSSRLVSSRLVSSRLVSSRLVSSRLASTLSLCLLGLSANAAAETQYLNVAGAKPLQVNINHQDVYGRTINTRLGWFRIVSEDREWLTLSVSNPQVGADFVGWSDNMRLCNHQAGTCNIRKSTLRNTTNPTLNITYRQGTATLLLHGMNSNATTWNALRDVRFGGSCADVGAGFFVDPARIGSRERCFRINFGKGSAIGLDGASAYNTQQQCNSGDASTYSELGSEVVNVLNNIQSSYPGIGSFVLVGHSRGGLAARAAFASNAPIMQKVRGLLTVGTPHQGSPLGRLYTWLRDARSRGASQAELDQAWRLANTVQWLSGLNMRCPTVDFLSPDSPLLASLNRHQLPQGRNYATLASNGLNLGLLQGVNGTQWVSFDVIGGSGLAAWNNLPLTASNYVLTGRWNNYSPWNRAGYEGDGIVTLSSQQAMPASIPTGNRSVVNQVYHVNETGSTTAINNLLNKL